MAVDVHLRDLRYFVAVAQHLHFSRAAEALHVSQPALSKQIRALETQLRTTLFERDRRGVQLTAAGAALLPEAQRVIEAWARAVGALDAAASTSVATLVVGMSTSLGRGLLPAVRARFAEVAPAAHLHLRQVPWADATGGLHGDGPARTDAAFVWLPLPEASATACLDVSIEPRLAALPTGHRLAERHTLDITDLLDEPFLALPRSSGPLRDHWLASDARGGRPSRIGAEIATIDEAVEALAAGLGICLIAAGNAPMVTRDGITTRPVTGVGPSHLVLAWRDDDRRPLLDTFRRAVEQALADQAAPPM